MSTIVAAVDCGATSVRVCRVDLDSPTLVADVVHRVAHRPVRDERGHLRWDWETIMNAVQDGLSACLEQGPLASIGVDTWAVDYGLIDERGELLSAPFSYRDHRTDRYVDLVNAFGATDMYRINGLQRQPFTTVFQLRFHDTEELERACRVLWLPELIIHTLTGVAVVERTSAVSSGLVDVSTGDWSPEMLELAGVTTDVLGPIEHGGQVVGAWHGIPVSLVAGHDTASAVAGMGTESIDGSAFISSGTWMLVGVERAVADTSPWAEAHNFANEAAALDGFRFLRNVPGFWIFEQCRASWNARGIDTEVESLFAAAEAVTERVPLFDVDDERLRSPTDMLVAWSELSSLPIGTAPGIVTRSIVESIVARIADVIDQLATTKDFGDLLLFGGASRIGLFARRLSETTGLALRIGSPEAAALGNAVVQGVAIGQFGSVAEGQTRIPTRTWGSP